MLLPTLALPKMRVVLEREIPGTERSCARIKKDSRYAGRPRENSDLNVDPPSAVSNDLEPGGEERPGAAEVAGNGSPPLRLSIKPTTKLPELMLTGEESVNVLQLSASRETFTV